MGKVTRGEVYKALNNLGKIIDMLAEEIDCKAKEQTPHEKYCQKKQDCGDQDVVVCGICADAFIAAYGMFDAGHGYKGN